MTSVTTLVRTFWCLAHYSLIQTEFIPLETDREESTWETIRKDRPDYDLTSTQL